MRLVWKREAHQDRLAGCLGQDIVGQMSPSSIKKKTTSPVCGGKLSGFVVLLRLVTHPISCPSSRRRPTAARPRAARRPHATWPRLVGVRDMCLIGWRPNPHPTHAGPHPPPPLSCFPQQWASTLQHGRQTCGTTTTRTSAEPAGGGRRCPAVPTAATTCGARHWRRSVCAAPPSRPRRRSPRPALPPSPITPRPPPRRSSSFLQWC